MSQGNNTHGGWEGVSKIMKCVQKRTGLYLPTCIYTTHAHVCPLSFLVFSLFWLLHRRLSPFGEK